MPYIIPLELCGFLLSSQNINVITQLIIITVEEKCKVVNLLLLQITHLFNKNSIHPPKKSFRRNVRQNKIGTSSMEPMQARIWMLDYKAKYYKKEPLKKALDALVLAKIPLSYNTYYTTTNKNSLKFLRTCTS
jgi:hypothetical protein